MNERLWHDAAMQKARVFLGLERKLLDLSLVILGYFLDVLIAAGAIFLAQCSNFPHFNGGLVASPSSPRKIVRDGFQTNLGVTVLGEILEIASFVGTPLGAVLAIGALAAAYFYGRWVLTD
jgi:phage-related holin